MTEAQDLPELDECGFVRVPSDGTPLYMTCEQCKKSDHFWMEEDRARCRCGQQYDHALRPDGSEVPFAELTFVPWNDGPMQLADTELDMRRLVIVSAIGVVLLASAGLALAWTMGWLG